MRRTTVTSRIRTWIAVEISDEWLHQIESEVPELPITRYERYLNEYGMTAMEARLLSDSFEKAELLDAAAKQVKPKAAANWILSDISKYLNDKGVSLRETKMTADKLVALVKLIEAGTISGNAGKKVLPSMFETDENVEAIVDRMGLKQVSDEGAILAIVQDVIAKNEKAVADFKAGKNVTGFLVGSVHEASKGQGNPQIINKLIASGAGKAVIQLKTELIQEDTERYCSVSFLCFFGEKFVGESGCIGENVVNRQI